MTVLPAVDVVVVGSGMGGAAFCFGLAEACPGLRIVCLERGHWLKPEDMPATRADWQSAVTGRWATSPNLRLTAGGNPWSADYPIDDADTPIKPLMWNGVGGSSVNWAAHFPRLKPSDFRTRSLDGVGMDWPFGYNDLAPFYDRNDAMMGVCGLNGDPAAPAKPARDPPLPLGRAGVRAAEAFNRLGWHWWPADAAILTKARGERQACNNCGPCLIGCTRHAKASVDVTYMQGAVGRGVELRTGAVAQQVITSNGRACGVVYGDESGNLCTQPASHVVVAANGIGTIRLLLASGLGRCEASVLGRHLMMHPVAYARGIFEQEMDGPAGPVGAMLCSHEFYETDRARGFARGLQIQITRENALLLQALRLSPAWGADAQRALAEEFRHSIVFMIVPEDLPEARNRVTVADRMAPDGLPEVKVSYTVSPETQAMIDFGYARAEEFFAAAGARRVLRAPLPPYTGWHLLGTARIGDDPETSFADRRGRVHEVEGLTIADGSAMPTVGAANPGSTIGALGLKFAADLAAELSA